MNKEQLFESMNGIDDEILEKSERGKAKTKLWRILVPAAACLCLVLIVAAIAVPAREAPPRQVEGEVHYNEAESWIAQEQPYTPFAKSLSEEELKQILPAKTVDWMIFSGTAFFGENRDIYYVDLGITASHGKTGITVYLGTDMTSMTSDDPMISQYGDVAYIVHEDVITVGNYIHLEAVAKINGETVTFSAYASPETVDQVRQDFENVLACFASYPEGKPDLSAIRLGAEPEWYDFYCTAEEAMADEKFGKYLPELSAKNSDPWDFRLWKNQSGEGLYSFWKTEDGFLEWDIYQAAFSYRTVYVDGAYYDFLTMGLNVQDGLVLVGAAPELPVCDAEELTLEMVEAEAFYEEFEPNEVRLDFSVKFGDTIIDIYSAGLEPELVYAQLVAVRERTAGNG